MRKIYVSALALLMMAGSAAVAQDLGAVARQQRQKKSPATKVYTNEDFPSHPEEATPTASVDGKPSADGKAADKSKEAAPEDKDKEAAAMQKRVDAQKNEIALLSREIDIADREFKLQVANYYGDAGNSLRDGKKWEEERKAKEDEINKKKKGLDDAKAKLADLIEQARKAGIKVAE